MWMDGWMDGWMFLSCLSFFNLQFLSLFYIMKFVPTVLSQVLYTSWKILEFKSHIFQIWKVIE